MFRVGEEKEEEPVEGREKVMRMVEILIDIKHDPIWLAGISTLSFKIILTKHSF